MKFLKWLYAMIFIRNDVDREYYLGRYKTFNTYDEFIKHLHSPKEQPCQRKR